MSSIQSILPRDNVSLSISTFPAPKIPTPEMIRNNKSALLAALSTSFNLTPSQIHSCESYYLLHWSTDWLYKQVKNDLTTLEHNGILYLLNWLDTPSGFSGQVRLSFRKLPDCSFGFCLLSPITL